MEEHFRELIDQLLSAKDLGRAQAIAVELQWAIYEYVDRLKEVHSKEVRSDDPQ